MGDDDIGSVLRLFAQEIPEITAGSVEIKAIARTPGYRCKLALHSQDPSVDCISVCVGRRGVHIKNIVDALGGERIDLIRWDESPERLIANAMQPAAIEKIILHPAKHSAVVVVMANQASLAHGRGGANRELASQICGWEIEIEIEEL
jgi:transcription termination/antitermination protein NusA